jgi:superfamily II DNA/RNA helicase
MSLLDIDFNFKCAADVEKSGLRWDYRFNQLQEIILKEDERTLIVSDSVEITEKSEQWVSEISSKLAMKTVLFYGGLAQEKFTANFYAFVVDKTANIGCSTSKMTTGLNFNVDHVIIAQLGKARFLDNELNTAITNIGRTGRNKRRGRVTIIFTHEDKQIGELTIGKAAEDRNSKRRMYVIKTESDDDASEFDKSEKEPLRKHSKPIRVIKDASGGEYKDYKICEEYATKYTQILKSVSVSIRRCSRGTPRKSTRSQSTRTRTKKSNASSEDR